MSIRKPRRRTMVGDTAWFVEWTTKQHFYDPAHPEDGGDPALDTTAGRRCNTQAEAERIARECYSLATVYGVVRYWPAEFVPYDPDDAAEYPWVGYWEPTGDDQIYEGDD